MSPTNQTVQSHSQLRAQPLVSVHLAPLLLHVASGRRMAVRLVMVAPVLRRIRQPAKQPQKRLGVPVSNLEVRPTAAVPLLNRRRPDPLGPAVFASPPRASTSHQTKPSSLRACPRLSHAPSSPTLEYPTRRACAPSAPRPLSSRTKGLFLTQRSIVPSFISIALPIDAALAPSAYMASARSMTSGTSQVVSACALSRHFKPFRCVGLDELHTISAC